MARTSAKRIRRGVGGLLWVAFVSALAAGVGARAQSSSQNGTPAESKGGSATDSTYARERVETVNLANGNLSLNIPLATLGGRGPLSYTVALSYNSKVWSSKHTTTHQAPVEQQLPNVEHYEAVYDEPNGIQPGRMSIGAGWFISDGPALKMATVKIDPVVPYSICFGLKDSEEPPCGFKPASSPA